MEAKGTQALEGVKVLDLGRMVNAPMATKYLGDHGATIVLVESFLYHSRGMFPFAEGKPGVNRSGTFTTYHTSKYGMTLDFNNPKGKEIAKRLIQWADVIVENFVPGAIDKWGLGYEDVRKLKPDIVMLSSSMLGQTGIHRMQKGTGEQLSSFGGFTNLTGWPDRIPVGIPNAYTDFIAPSYIIIAILAALSYRRKTGKGTYIDLAQFESGISFLPHLVLDYFVNGRVQEACGNRCQHAAPHGVYRCKGDDRWCAIAVASDGEWENFRKVIGEPQWSRETRFDTLSGRKTNENELDTLIENWTVNYPAEEVMKKMQQAGVAAGVVQNNKDLSEDPQLQHRKHFVMLEQAEMGFYPHEAAPFRLSRTPAELRMGAPCLGEHTQYICKEILGISDEEFSDFTKDGAFGSPPR